MIISLTLLIIIGVFFYGLYISRKTRDYLNPIMSFAGPILVGFLFFIVYYRDDCSENTVLMYLCGIVFFVMGFVLHRTFSQYSLEYTIMDDNKPKSIVDVSPLFKNLFKIITLLSVLLTLRYIYSIAFQGPFGSNVIRNIRYMSNYVTEKGFITEYSMVVAKVFLCILLYQLFVQNYEGNKTWILITTAAAIVGIASTIARTQILSLAISWYYLYSLKKITNNKDTVKITWQTVKEKWYIVIAIAVIMYVFYYFAAQTSKLGSGGITSKEFFLNRYFGQELVHFEENAKGYGGSGNGYYSLGWVTKILSAIGLVKSPGILESIILRTHGAVCSFMRTPYIDFGWVGICIIMFIMGFANSFIYKRVLKRMGYWCLFYTTCIYSNIMAFFDYQYMMSGQMYFLVVLIFAGGLKLRLGKRRLT